MARPLRIEFEGAWYHVMNRGAARQGVFVSDDHRHRFLELLGDLASRFEIETHSYCLMTNHYHLLLHTPHGNLGRGMRHLNGVYTQYFNRDQRRDGALFRGRYKAILVDADAYLLHLSSYIHLNPLESGMVERLEDYPWSSYPAYVGRHKPERWLARDMVYSMLGGRAGRYRSFVEQGVDEDVQRFYSGKYLSPILGDDVFKETVLERYGSDDPEVPERKRLREPPSLDKIIDSVSMVVGCDRQHVYESVRGRRNVARMLVTHFASTIGQLTHREVAEVLGLKHYSAVASSRRRLKRLLEDDRRITRLCARIEEQMAKDAT